MSEPIDFNKAKAERKAMCLYCAGDPHPTPLACPRIVHLQINCEGYVEGITFRDDYFEDDEPDDAA